MPQSNAASSLNTRSPDIAEEMEILFLRQTDTCRGKIFCRKYSTRIYKFGVWSAVFLVFLLGSLDSFDLSFSMDKSLRSFLI